MSHNKEHSLNDLHDEYNIEYINKEMDEMTELEEQLKQQLSACCGNKNDSNYNAMTSIAHKMISKINESQMNSHIFLKGEEIIKFSQKCIRTQDFTSYHRPNDLLISRLEFSPSKIKKYLERKTYYQKANLSKNNTKKFMIYCAAVMEYISAELIEISGNVTKKAVKDKNNQQRMIITANDVQKAIIKDPEFPDFFKDQNLIPLIEPEENKLWNPTYYEAKHLIFKWLIENKLIMKVFNHIESNGEFLNVGSLENIGDINLLQEIFEYLDFSDLLFNVMITCKLFHCFSVPILNRKYIESQYTELCVSDIEMIRCQVWPVGPYLNWSAMTLINVSVMMVLDKIMNTLEDTYHEQMKQYDSKGSLEELRLIYEYNVSIDDLNVDIGVIGCSDLKLMDVIGNEMKKLITTPKQQVSIIFDEVDIFPQVDIIDILHQVIGSVFIGELCKYAQREGTRFTST
eukprot:544360_1